MSCSEQMEPHTLKLTDTKNAEKDTLSDAMLQIAYTYKKKDNKTSKKTVRKNEHIGKKLKKFDPQFYSKIFKFNASFQKMSHETSNMFGIA